MTNINIENNTLFYYVYFVFVFVNIIIFGKQKEELMCFLSYSKNKIYPSFGYQNMVIYVVNEVLITL